MELERLTTGHLRNTCSKKCDSKKKFDFSVDNFIAGKTKKNFIKIENGKE